MNISNFSKGFLQLNHSITEADLFRIYINIDFSSFDINIGISGLRLISETTKISELKQTVTSSFNALKVFSQINSDFKQSLLLLSELHSQQQSHTDNLTSSNTVDMQTIF